MLKEEILKLPEAATVKTQINYFPTTTRTTIDDKHINYKKTTFVKFYDHEDWPDNYNSKGFSKMDTARSTRNGIALKTESM